MSAKLMWTSLATSVWLGLITALPIFAAPAVLDGNEPGSRVNIRSAPTNPIIFTPLWRGG